MPIPDYQSLMLPLLRITGDRQEHSFREAIDTLAQQFSLSEDERRELLPSGVQPKFDNRVSWARIYLSKAGLLEATGRARFRATVRGLEVLREAPPRIDVRFLKRFPEFVEFQAKPRQGAEKPEEEHLSRTPAEVLEQSYQSLRQELAQELLERIKKCSPAFFERLVVDLLVAMAAQDKMRGKPLAAAVTAGLMGSSRRTSWGLMSSTFRPKDGRPQLGGPLFRPLPGAWRAKGHAGGC